MRITPNTLFHFTKTRSNLENILTEKFKVTYCRENFELGETPSGGMHFPMISFCDIPIAMIDAQLKKYGSYVIGMSKEWGIKNNLNPVLYLEKQSNIAKDFDSQTDAIGKLVDLIGFLVKEKKLNTENSEHIGPIVSEVNEILNFNKSFYRYAKNYEGVLERGSKTYPNYRFYDEREWRFVPEIKDTRMKWKLNKKEYEAFRGSGRKKNFLDEPVLNFRAKDIRHLIVKSELDIPPLISKIKSVDDLCKTANEADSLITRIITSTALKSDF